MINFLSEFQGLLVKFSEDNWGSVTNCDFTLLSDNRKTVSVTVKGEKIRAHMYVYLWSLDDTIISIQYYNENFDSFYLEGHSVLGETKAMIELAEKIYYRYQELTEKRAH